MSHQAPRTGRNRKVAIGAASALAVLVGGGAYLIGARHDDLTQDPGAIAPLVTVFTEAPTPAPAPSPVTSATSAAPAAAATRAASPRLSSPSPVEPRREIDAARSRAAQQGVPLQRPLTTAPQPQVAAEDADSLVEDSRPLADGGTMRVMSAHYDLSGRPEMLWAADAGTPAGSARCTQNFRFAQGQPPTVRKDMLLCWRNTADRSVVVLAVSHTGVPNSAQVLNVLDTQWNRL